MDCCIMMPVQDAIDCLDGLCGWINGERKPVSDSVEHIDSQICEIGGHQIGSQRDALISILKVGGISRMMSCLKRY